MKKLLVVGVIVLFLGVAFAPSINANISKTSIDSELVEITTEVCGLNGGKQTVELTQEEAAEVEALFDSIRAQLNETETREEAEEVFKEAVVELDKYGLLGGLSIEQAQKLVTGGYQNSRVIKALEKLYGRNQDSLDDDANVLCLIAGNTSETIILGPSTIFRILINIPIVILITLPAALICYILDICSGLLNFLFGVGYFLYIIADFFGDIAFWFALLSLASHVVGFPFAELGGFISFGHRVNHIAGGYWNYYPANGWIFTSGLYGTKLWNGKFYGQLKYGIFRTTGASGFTGLMIGGSGFLGFPIGGGAYYLGSVLEIKIGDKYP